MLRIFRHYVSAPAVSLLVLDTAVIAVVLFGFSVFARGEQPAALHGAALPSFALAALPAMFISLVMYSTGAYDKTHLDNYRHLMSRLAVCLGICLVVFVFVYQVDSTYFLRLFGVSNSVYFLALVLVFPAVFSTRVAYVSMASRLGADRRILVIGTGPMAGRIERLARRHLDFSVEIVGYVATPTETVEVPRELVIEAGDSLAATANRLGVTEIVVALTERRGMSTAPLLECRLRGIAVTNLLSFWERETRQVMLDSLDPSWLIYSDGFRLSMAVNAFLKRSFDVVVSCAFLLFTLPILAIAAVVIRLDSAGPVFYMQERVGRNGRTFNLYKLRSMRADAEKAGAPQWASARDPRVTRVGALLRLTRIDELPQVLNVLKGDMSFIGPRPERPFFVESLSREIPYYMERLRVRPGITGWAQISYPYGASIEDAKAKLSYDLYYIKNYSILFDLLVLFATVQVVLWNKGAR
jgi:sugar transferase (PEP-CTERM system associated)